MPLPEDQLPLLLPEVESYEPTDNGESPLAKMTDWVNTTCPHCGGPAKRETDTMPQWAGSSWYFLRYMDPHNDKALASPEALKYWSPVDWYNGGMEHTTLHLLYSRFWHKFLYDIGVVPTKEPYHKRTSHGMILGEGGEKMSKSRGNVVNPNDVVDQYGADTMRTYIMFIGDFEKAAAWSDNAVKGCKRFLDRVWNLAEQVSTTARSYSKANEAAVHKAIKKVSEDIEAMKFNTAIAALMALVNDFYANGVPPRASMKALLLSCCLPSPPTWCEELWEQLRLRRAWSAPPAPGPRMTRARPWPPRSRWPSRWAASSGPPSPSPPTASRTPSWPRPPPDSPRSRSSCRGHGPREGHPSCPRQAREPDPQAQGLRQTSEAVIPKRATFWG